MAIVGSFAVADDSMATPEWAKSIANWFRGAEKKVEHEAQEIEHGIENSAKKVGRFAKEEAEKLVNFVRQHHEVAGNATQAVPE